MGVWSIKTQVVYARGDLRLEFRKLGRSHVLEVEERGTTRRIYFGADGNVTRVEVPVPSLTPIEDTGT